MKPGSDSGYHKGGLYQPVSCFLTQNLPLLLPQEHFQAADLAGAGPAQPQSQGVRGSIMGEGC